MRQRESIASRLSTTVTLIMVLTVLLIGAAVYWQANRMVSTEVGRSALSQLELVSGSIDERAREAMLTADEAARQVLEAVAEERADTATLCAIVAEAVRRNPLLEDCIVTLQDCPRSAIADRDSAAVTSMEMRQMAWYTSARNAGRGVWVDPQPDDLAEGNRYCFYSLPLYTEDSLFLGVLSVDLGTSWIDSAVNRIHIFEHSYPMVFSPNGECLNSPSISILPLVGTPDEQELTQLDIHTQVADRALYQKRGGCKVRTPDFRATAFFLPIESTEWEIAVACPFTDAYTGLEKFLFFSLLIVLGFSVVLIAVINAAITKATAPLSEFAAMARKVAVGEFDAQLPEAGGKSEMADLYESFGFMQQSLAKNIEELKKSTAEQERLESEFHIARKIQLDLVPNIFPAFPERKDIDIHAVINPWRESGGNLYDFGIVDNRLLFCIGDVAGNGILAAIFMSTTFKLIHTSLYNNASPAEVMSFTNRTMALHNDSDMFVTLFYGALDLATGELTYCSAGQDEPMLVAPDGTVAPLEITPNVPVGLMEETEYEEQKTTIEPGTMLVMYTDGVVEAQNRGGDLYGADRLMRRLQQHAKKNCQQVVEAIREDVRTFTHDETQDDCTALAIRWR